MMSTQPLVSVAVPVYNGERYLRATLDSILNQTWRNLELIICDNCSTDGTEKICREYAERDPRVRYFRADRNLGPARNFNRAVPLARGRYFKWNAADDLCAPTFIEECVAMLEADTSLVLAYPRTIQIDSEGKEVGRVEYQPTYDRQRAWRRLARLLFVDHRRHGAHELYGVIRLDWLNKTSLCGAHVRADSVLLAKLALLGGFGQVEQYLFLNRDHNDRSSRTQGQRYVRAGSRLSAWIGAGPLPPAEWWDSAMKGRIVFPEWRVMLEYGRAIHETWMAPLTRARCYGVFALYVLRHLPKLARDVVIAAEQFVRRLPSLIRFHREPNATAHAQP